MDAEPESGQKRRPGGFVPDHGWSWVILVAAFFCNFTFDGIIFSFGVLYIEFLDYFEEGRGLTSWVGSVISGTYAIVGPVASILANKYGCRIVTMGGSVIACAGFLICTFSPNIRVMIFTYGVMGGVGFGLMYLCVYVMIGHYFDKRRALATGIASCGSGVGTFVFAPLTLFLIETYGWKGAMWILAGIVLNGLVLGATFTPIPPQTDDDGLNLQPKLIDWKLLRTPAFLVFCMSSFLCLLGFFVPFVYLPDFALRHGINKTEATLLLSIIGITNTSGRILCGWVSDKRWADPLKIYNGALILGGIATMACSFLTSFVSLVIYCVIFGLCVAAYVSLCTIILVEFLGLDKLSNSFGFLNMFRGISTFIGTPIAGMMFDVTGRYDFAFYIAGASIAAAGVVCLPLRILNRCEGTRKTIQQYNKQRQLATESDSIKYHTESVTEKSISNEKMKTNRTHSDIKHLSGYDRESVV